MTMEVSEGRVISTNATRCEAPLSYYYSRVLMCENCHACICRNSQ